MIREACQKEWFCNKIEEYETELYRLAVSILKNEEDAKDAVSEAILRAYSRLELLHDEEKFKPWMMRIVCNCAYDIVRKRRNVVSMEEDFEPPARSENIEMNVSLRTEIMRLAMDYRAVVVLFYYDDMGIREISNILHISQNAVKTRLCRARAMLARRLGDA